MIVIEEKPEVDIRSHSTLRAVLRVDSADISFEDVAGGKVRVHVRVHNDGERRSLPTSMRVESAPLGAFVPWQPLTVLRVPSIESGESREVNVEVERSRSAALGSFDRVPPRTLLTALSAPDEPSPRDPGSSAMLNLLRRRMPDRGPAVTVKWQLAPDLMELVGRGQPHWAGNINVFVNATPVERHMAKALRVYPGRPNMAMFMVGGWGRRGRGQSDAYSFEMAGVAPDWQAALFDVTNGSTLVVGSDNRPIPEAQWVEASGGLMVILVVHPPAGCGEGNLGVRVTRRSCQKTAVVEFNLDPSAQGSGCYYV